MIPGTVVYDLVSDRARHGELLRIGHPGGVIDVGAVVELSAGGVVYREAVLGRTARRLMDGRVLVPATCFAPGGRLRPARGCRVHVRLIGARLRR